MKTQVVLILFAVLPIFCGTASSIIAQEDEFTDAELVKQAVNNLIQLQEQDGSWPYEGVYRVNGKIPVGYRIGGTAIVCTSLLAASANDDQNCAIAINKGIQLILTELEHPLMKPSVEDRYDVRVWGHIYALDLFCRLKLRQRQDTQGETLISDEVCEKTDPWISKLVAILIEQEIKDGGWNYANHRSHACFVTAPAVQSLLLAKKTGQNIPDDLLERSATILLKSRIENGAFQYSGTTDSRRVAKLPGSIARSPICEATLLMLGKGDQSDLQNAIDAFHEHWNELEKRRKKTGTHKPPYGVAPYYFYYGHRYLAQSIALLPKEKRAAELERFHNVLLKTRDEDGTWNDRVFDRSKAYGTAMAILAIRADTTADSSFKE